LLATLESIHPRKVAALRRNFVGMANPAGRGWGWGAFKNALAVISPTESGRNNRNRKFKARDFDLE
jgi:hypothetical protein